jgi:hypothetical protein
VSGPFFQCATAPVTSFWTDAMNGSVTGLAAGTSLCHNSGWDHYCDYTELLGAQAQAEFATVLDSTTGWVNRTTTAQVNGQPSAPGLGGNGNNCTYVGNILANGEYVTFASGVPTYHLDNDTIYDPANPGAYVDPTDLHCLGVARSILCCAATCAPGRRPDFAGAIARGVAALRPAVHRPGPPATLPLMAPPRRARAATGPSRRRTVPGPCSARDSRRGS